MKKARRHEWQRQVGGDEVCPRCGVRRRKSLKVISSVFGRKGETTYYRFGEVLDTRPPCVDERQGDLFPADLDDGADR